MAAPSPDGAPSNNRTNQHQRVCRTFAQLGFFESSCYVQGVQTLLWGSPPMVVRLRKYDIRTARLFSDVVIEGECAILFSAFFASSLLVGALSSRAGADPARRPNAHPYFARSPAHPVSLPLSPSPYRSSLW